MKIIYIAGAYSSDSRHQQYLNVKHATEATHRLLCEGYSVVCPIITYAFFDWVYDLTNRTFMDADLVLLRRCDAIYMLNNWKSSKGARAEYKLTKMLGLEIIFET